MRVINPEQIFALDRAVALVRLRDPSPEELNARKAELRTALQAIGYEIPDTPFPQDLAPGGTA